MPYVAARVRQNIRYIAGASQDKWHEGRSECDERHLHQYEPSTFEFNHLPQSHESRMAAFGRRAWDGQCLLLAK
jgi:hypothetical protein